MRRISWLIAVLMFVMCRSNWCAAESKTDAHSTGIAALDAADIAPGKSIKIDDPLTGGKQYWMLEIPQDYDPARKWPVIFVEHGAVATPSTWPFGPLTDNKGFILVGMEVEDPDNHSSQVDKNLPNLKRIHDALAKKLPLDERFMFLGGLSQGAFRAADYGEASFGAWAGEILLLGGRGDWALAHTGKVTNFQKEPFLIADGVQDRLYPEAQDAAKFYSARNADVTTEWFPNLGHEVDTNDKVLKTWLLDHGPVAQVKLEFDQAVAAQKAGRVGQAYALYQPVINQQISSDLADKSKTAAQAIEDQANKAMDLAEKDLATRLSTGMRDLQEVARVYAGSPMGDKATARLADLRSHPTTAPAPPPPSATPTSAPAAPQPPPAAPAANAETQCKQWLNLADNYIQAGDVDQARAYLQKVIDNYPKSAWADTAREKLKSLQ